jgi:signal transduction histidine kinase
MQAIQTLVGFVYLISLLVLGILAYRVYQQRGTGTTNSLFYMTLAGFLFIGSSFVVIVASSKLIMRLGLFLVAPSHWLLGLTIALFTLHFTGYYNRIDKRAIYAIYGIYGTLFAISITNPFHNLIVQGYGVSTSPFPYVYAIPNIGLPVFLAVGYLSNFAIAITFLIAVFNSSRLSLRQFLTLSFIAAGTSFIHFAEYLAYQPRFAAGPFGFSAMFIIAGFAYLVLHEDILSLDPITRRDVISSLTQPIIISNSNGSIIDYNAAAISLFPSLEGNTGNQIEYVIPELVESVSSVDGTRSFTDEISTTGPDNKFKEYQVSAEKVSKDDRFYGTTLVLSDVTELKIYAQDLEQQTDQLEDFTSFVSHDLRNPIASSQQYLGLIEGKTEDHEHYIEKVEDGLERMNTMIENLLTLAREGKAIEDRNTTSLQDTAEYAWEISDTKDGVLECDNIDTAVVYADKDRLYTLFENLFRNAADHAADNVTVTIGASPEQNEFYIADDGPGLPDDVNIFEKGVTTSRNGTGLGLAIVERIVEAHGWEIEAGEYEPTGGAKFTITGVKSLQLRSAQAGPDRKQNVES